MGQSCKFGSCEDTGLRASPYHQTLGVGQGRAQAWESGLISLFHKASASSDLHALSVNLGWGWVTLAVPAMVTSFPAQEALSVATAWGGGGVGWERTAPKGISGAGVAK